jgi:GNAT superfamily N-acetyltransferase
MVSKSGSDKDSAAVDSANPKWAEEKRREIRLRRSRLLDNPAEVAITYKIASTREELEDSFRLVWEAYVKVGLQEADTTPLRFTKYHLLPTSKVFIAIHRAELEKEQPDYEQLKQPGRIVGTLTLVRDGGFGLPMEEVCGDAVDAIRGDGGAPAEVIALAVDPEFRSHNVMMYLYKLMFEYARLCDVSDITCSVTKRHIRFYQSMLLFEPMGELKAYGAANGQEVQCHRLNIEHGRQMAEDVYHSQHFDADLYTFFFTENKAFGRAAGEGQPMDAEMLRYFLEQKSRMREALSSADLETLRAAYAARGLQFPY